MSLHPHNLTPAPVPSRRPNWLSTGSEKSMPVIFLRSAESGKRFWEFFTANIRNRNTRISYFTAVSQFSEWCERKNLILETVQPIHVAAYIEELGKMRSKPTVKQHLAAIRMLFDWLVNLQNGGKLEVAQQMAGHESARTTGLYDRRNDSVALDEVERIAY